MQELSLFPPCGLMVLSSVSVYQSLLYLLIHLPDSQFFAFVCFVLFVFVETGFLYITLVVLELIVDQAEFQLIETNS